MRLLVLAIAALAMDFLLTPIVSVLIGAFTGWVVGFAFPNTLDIVSQTITHQVLPHWQLGAGLGFVGGFFRTTVKTKD